ncbi:ATP-binding protein [Leptolyngbya sp. FACHB-711]|uniref:ATP-binding protein n=1 Tax=unclassified Leptolyngbya TaxID=2650499 RepID=UPI0018EFD02B
MAEQIDDRDGTKVNVKLLQRKRALGAGFASVIVLMGFTNWTSYQNAKQLIESTNQSKQTYEVIKSLANIFSTMTVAESGRRGYVFLSDHAEYLRYQEAVKAIVPKMQLLQQQIDTNSEQIAQFNQLKQLLDRRIILLEQSIQLHQKQPNDRTTQAEITEQSIQLREQIALVMNQMQAEEEQRLQQWLNQSQTSIRSRYLIEFLISLSSLAIFLGFALLLYYQYAQRQQAEKLRSTLLQEKELSELKVKFFSMVSHEFRTPLSVILGSAQLMRDNEASWTKERQQKNLERIQSSAKLMKQMLSDILTLTRAEAGKLEFNPQPIDLEAFCLNLVEEIQLSMRSSHPVQIISQGSQRHVLLDEKLLYSILSNLLCNAIKYSSSTSLIELLLDCQPGQTILQIKDNGLGIAPADRSQIFEAFYRGQNSISVSGSGLGLAVVKQCVDRHQGNITIDSIEDKGTTFTVTLPHISARSAHPPNA